MEDITYETDQREAISSLENVNREHEAEAGHRHSAANSEQPSTSNGAGSNSYPPAYDDREVILDVSDAGGGRDSTRPTSVVAPAREKKPNDYKELAFISCVFNMLCGLVALAYAAKSWGEYKRGNVKAARRYGKCSLIFSLMSLAGVLVIVTVCVWWFAPAAGMQPQPVMVEPKDMMDAMTTTMAP